MKVAATRFAGTAADSARHKKAAIWNWVMFSTVLATIPAFYIELAAHDPRLRLAGLLLNASVLTVFALRLGYLLHGATSLRLFLRRNGLDLAIATGAAGSLAGSYGTWSTFEWVLRLLFVALIVARILISLRRLFSPTGTIYMIGLGAGMMLVAGAGFYWLEPTVHSYADGLWLAFVSAATVGYGDLVPTTPASRLFAAFIVLLGYALLTLVTASIAAIFIGEDEKILRREMHHDIKQLREDVAALRAELQSRADPLASPGPDE